MPIQQIRLRELTVFEDSTLDLAPGVNVLIGANGTGKTHLMKAAYAVLNVFKGPSGLPRAAELEQEIAAVFRPNDDKVGRLTRRRSGTRGNSTATVDVAIDDASCSFTLHGKPLSSGSMLELVTEPESTYPPPVFVPPNELLSSFEGFVAAYERRELRFDKTYRDLAVALSAATLRRHDTTDGSNGDDAVARLRREVGSVSLERDQFYMKRPEGKIEAPLVAEGLRKLGTLIRLIDTGAIGAGSVLFWDEPEANLNPALSGHLVDALLELAQQGAQVVIATHDYLIANRISVIAEMSARTPPIRFFSFFSAGRRGPVSVETADTLAGIENDLLLQAFEDQVDFEHRLASDLTGS